MSWISLVVAAVTGGLVALIASLLLPHDKDDSGSGKSAVGVAAVIGVVLAHFLLTPKLETAWTMRSFEKALSENAAFAAIKRYDAPTYDKLMLDVKNGLASHTPEIQITAMVRNQITAIVQKRLPRSTNEAAVAYMQVMVQEMRELKSHDGQMCYQFLYPQPGQTQDISKVLSDSTKKADLTALGQVIKLAALTPQEVPKQDQVMPFLTPVFTSLGSKYGDDLRDLQNPKRPGVNQTRLCSMMIDLYQQIAQLPGEQGGMALRFMLAQGQ